MMPAHVHLPHGAGRYGLAALIALLVVIYLGAAFGPPPPSVRVLAISTLPGVLLAVWGAWGGPAPRSRRLTGGALVGRDAGGDPAGRR